ncbi:hypothetical protein HG536_0H01540 [Torulaspora globosa]|uniref:C2H2-type domain-containing protein n=1 Tax=Torulaspora globosa TaxID=48254 RepID=A0A7G3ZMP3_9SACH|nr:uncharacterized protein HG536_0H01540 [Torulaspora globosa]QLL34779.1 hypothetical protein HG536_0H01540 [Torulaspora globosa]
MSEEALFFSQAAEAIVATSLNAANVDPTIRELLSRIKYSLPGLPPAQAQESQNGVANDAGTVLPETRDVTNGPGVLEYFASPMSLSISNGNGSQTSHTEHFNISPGNSNAKGSGESTQGVRNQSDKSAEEKKYSCAKCKLEFRRTSDLRRHERTHLPVLPNICPQCGKGFARKDALKRHSNTLTCRRNRSKLLSIGGDINDILERVQQTGNGT